MSNLIKVQSALTADLTSMIEDTLRYAEASRSSNTVAQYTKNWNAFSAFCDTHGLAKLPSTIQVVSVYLSHLAKSGKAVSTVVSHLSAIKYFHDRERITSINWADPTLSEVSAGIRRTSTRKVVKAAAILPEDLRLLASTTGTGAAGTRDRAILLVGFAGAFRRSEITGLTVENLEFCDEGVVIQIDRSKTDQEGRGAEVCIPFGKDATICPVLALQAWLTASGVEAGPVFRRVTKSGSIGENLSEEGIRLILTKAVERSGLESTGRISPHSLRAGFCTSAALAGKSMDGIASHARHSSVQTTMGYIRVAERFKNHAGAGLL
jgi:site-specific recombinase XerD